jgi:predicted TIM-barrel fold metal-dependent hydrolase
MLLDCHNHSVYGKTDIAHVKREMAGAGVDGAALFSQHPGTIFGKEVIPAKERLQEIMRLTAGEDRLWPFFYLDPTEPDAVEQVDEAVSAGIRGFKITCNHFYPYDERCVPAYRRIAQSGKPLLFHSGILYDGKNASGNFNRPCNFEVLLSIEGLRFALAHVSWPWTDECIAVYGKFNDYRSRNAGAASAEMFLDVTPGTPPIYRRGLLERLFFAGYDIENNILWGTDNFTDNYSADYAREVYFRDKGFFQELNIPEPAQEKVFSKNLLRFLGE